MPASARTTVLRQHYRPSRFRTPGWLRQLWVWF